MKTNIKARITGSFICKTTIMVNKREKSLLYNFYFRQTAIVIFSLMLSLSFYSFLLFSLTFFVLILLYLSGTYILFLPVGGRGARAPSAPPLRTRLLKQNLDRRMNVKCFVLLKNREEVRDNQIEHLQTYWFACAVQSLY